MGREEALGLFLETGSAFCPEVEITGQLSVQSEGRDCQGKLMLQILREIMDGCPAGKRTENSQARCALHLRETSGTRVGSGASVELQVRRWPGRCRDI